MTNQYYSTIIGNDDVLAYNSYKLYFANENDLIDHLQNVFNCTLNDLEFSSAWQDGRLFEIHKGSINKQFCDNHNKNRIDYDCDYEFDASDLE